MDPNRREENNWDGWRIAKYAGGVMGALAVVGGVAYKLLGSETTQQNRKQRADEGQKRKTNVSSPEGRSSSSDSSGSSFLTDLLNRVDLNRNNFRGLVTPQGSVPDFESLAVVTNLNSVLSNIYVQYVLLKNDDFTLHYGVFDKIFQHLHKKMKAVDLYYNRYSSMVQFAGSHYDRLRINKPDEFDMDIVIGLPLNIQNDPWDIQNNDFIFELKDAGFLNLKMGTQFQNLPQRDKYDWEINKAAYRWKDENNYLLRSKFIDWFKSVVARALNEFDRDPVTQLPVMSVYGTEYIIGRSESGPAVTLIIRNKMRTFKMDVDLVPALKFPETRWPLSKDYREIPSKCKKDYWMVVPKKNMNSPEAEQTRSWRIALHYQERELMYNSRNLRVAIKLVKKLRDSQEMTKIASYYIKTVAYWEIVRINDDSFWTRSPREIFKLLVHKLYEAVSSGQIPYFWNKKNNLLDGVKRSVLDIYTIKLRNFISVLDNPSEYKQVAKFLLTKNEFDEFNRNFLYI